MLRCTNQELAKDNITKETTKGKILAFFGVQSLMTKFEFTSRASLLTTMVIRKYVTAPSFGKNGMRWSEQPDVCPEEGMSSEKYRWLLLYGFVERFNEYRAATFTPSKHICVDESISRWYGQGGYLINPGSGVDIHLTPTKRRRSNE
jgi:hypothetical protein